MFLSSSAVSSGRRSHSFSISSSSSSSKIESNRRNWRSVMWHLHSTSSYYLRSLLRLTNSGFGFSPSRKLHSKFVPVFDINRSTWWIKYSGSSCTKYGKYTKLSAKYNIWCNEIDVWSSNCFTMDWIKARRVGFALRKRLYRKPFSAVGGSFLSLILFWERITRRIKFHPCHWLPKYGDQRHHWNSPETANNTIGRCSLYHVLQLIWQIEAVMRFHIYKTGILFVDFL